MMSISSFSPDVRRTVRIEIGAALLVTLFTGLTGPFTGLILRRELGATPMHFSLLASANAACLLLSVLLARLVDTRRPLPWVVWPTFAARGLFLLVPLIASPWPFLGLMVAGTLLNTVAGPAQSAMIQRLYPPDARGRALGAVRVAGAVAAIALSAVAGHLLLHVDYRHVFGAAALLGMAGSMAQLRLTVPEAPAAAAPERPGLREAWRAIARDRRYRGLLIASTVFGSGIWLQMPATPLLLADVAGVSTAQAGVLSGIAATAALGANVLWGRLVDRRSSVRALRVVYCVGTLTPIAYYAVSRVPSATWLLAAGTVFESLMATGLDLVWMLAVIDAAGPRRAAHYAAIAGTVAGVRGILGPMAGAALIQWFGVHAVYLAATALMATGAWLVGRLASAPQNTPRYIEQPRHTSGGLSVSSAALKLS